jgi:acetyltransferase-like isoleucine patch superfamily enzyme
MKKIVNKLKSKLIYELNKLIRPEMISYNRWNNEIIYKTIISNTSHISNKHNVEIGSNVLIFHNTYIDGFFKITLREGVAIGHCSTLLTHSSHNSLRLHGKNYSITPSDQIKGLVKGEIYIGEYSFVGPNCVIMPGTIIGKGCIVAAYSFVNGEYPDFAIIKGNPAIIVGSTRELDEKYLKRYPNLQNTYFSK